jgi:hypothetical protein
MIQCWRARPIGSRAFYPPRRQSFSAKTERLNSNGSAVCDDADFLTGHESKRGKPLTIQSEAWDNALVLRCSSPHSVYKLETVSIRIASFARRLRRKARARTPSRLSALPRVTVPLWCQRVCAQAGVGYYRDSKKFLMPTPCERHRIRLVRPTPTYAPIEIRLS